MVNQTEVFKITLVDKACETCSYADQPLDYPRCTKCVEIGMRKVNYRAKKVKKGGKVEEGSKIVNEYRRLQDRPGELIIYLDGLRMPSLQKLARGLGIRGLGGTGKYELIDMIIEGVE